jgi:hypothetical protein
METRRIRRLKQRHVRRVVLGMTSIGALGLAVGLALPRSITASVVLLAVAVVSLAAVGARADSLAPIHGLDGVGRLSTVSAISTAFDSFRSRIVGTARTIRERVSLQLAGSADDLEQGADELARPIDPLTMPEAVIKVRSRYEPRDTRLAPPSPERLESSGVPAGCVSAGARTSTPRSC